MRKTSNNEINAAFFTRKENFNISTAKEILLFAEILHVSTL
jgi:hypothetical protein